MKDLILDGCKLAYKYAIKTTMRTKQVERFISLSDVNPRELQEFMEKNNIPLDAWFGGKDNGYDGYDEIGLCWDKTEPKSKTQYDLDFNKNFTISAFRNVALLLKDAGYKRIPVNGSDAYKSSGLLASYLSGNTDDLIKYYSQFFKKEV